MEKILRDHVQKYLPDIFGLFFKEPNWEKLTKKVNNSQGSGATSYLEANLYEIFNGAEKGDHTALGLLEYFNIILRETCLLDKDSKKKLNLNAKKILTEISPNFKHFIGEFAVLDGIIKTGQFSLVRVEENLENGMSIDYLMRDNIDNKIYHVEVLNINVNETHSNLKQRITTKLLQKVSTKTKNMPDSFDILVVPVIWARRHLLKKLHDAYNENFHVEHTYEPFAFSAEPNIITGEGEYRFHRISNLFNPEK